jgi:hypothetical protein
MTINRSRAKLRKNLFDGSHSNSRSSLYNLIRSNVKKPQLIRKSQVCTSMSGILRTSSHQEPAALFT